MSDERERHDPVAERLARAVDEGDEEVWALAREVERYRSPENYPAWLIIRTDEAYRRLQRQDAMAAELAAEMDLDAGLATLPDDEREQSDG